MRDNSINFKILKILIFLLIVALIFGIGMRLFLELNKSNIVESITIEDKYYNSLDELKADTTININIQCNLGGNATYVIKSDQSIELRDESTVYSIKRTNTNEIDALKVYVDDILSGEYTKYYKTDDYEYLVISGEINKWIQIDKSSLLVTRIESTSYSTEQLVNMNPYTIELEINKEFKVHDNTLYEKNTVGTEFELYLPANTTMVYENGITFLYEGNILLIVSKQDTMVDKFWETVSKQGYNLIYLKEGKFKGIEFIVESFKTIS